MAALLRANLAAALYDDALTGEMLASFVTLMADQFDMTSAMLLASHQNVEAESLAALALVAARIHDHPELPQTWCCDPEGILSALKAGPPLAAVIATLAIDWQDDTSALAQAARASLPH